MKVTMKLDMNMALIKASENNNLALIKILHENGASLNFKQNEHFSPLYYLIKKRNFEGLDYLKKYGVDLSDKIGVFGRTPLHFAV